MLDGDLVAEEPRCAGAGVGDQGLGLVQFQLPARVVVYYVLALCLFFGDAFAATLN